MSREVKIGQAIFGVSGMVVLSKLLGFAREMVIAERFGTSWEYDLLLLGMAVPIFLNLVFVNATNLLIVPALTRIKGKNPDRDYRRILWRIYSSLLLISLLAAIAVSVASPFLVKIIAPNLPAEQYPQAALYCRLISVLIVLGFSESYLRSTLNIEKNFVYPAAGTIVMNIIAIAAIYFLSPQLSVLAIVVGLLGGSFVQVMYLLFKLAGRKGATSIKAEFFGKEFRGILTIGVVIIGVEIVSRTYFLIDRYYASDMTTGVVSALNYCSMLVMLPVNIIAFAVASVTFPFLSERAVNHSSSAFASLLQKTIRLLLALGIPCALFYWLFSGELVTAVFYRGAFDAHSLELTSNILRYLAPYLLALFLYTVLIQAAYSSGKQKIVLAMAVVAMAAKFGLAGILSQHMGYTGIPLSTTIIHSAMVAGLIAVLFHHHKLSFDFTFGVAVIKILIASAPIALLAVLYYQFPQMADNGGIIARYRVLPAAVIAGILYIVVGRVLKLQEITSLFELVSRGRN